MIIESRDVFFEDVFPYKRKENNTSRKRTHEIMFRDERPSEPIIDVEFIHEGVRDREYLNSLVQTLQHMRLKVCLKYLKKLCLKAQM